MASSSLSSSFILGACQSQEAAGNIPFVCTTDDEDDDETTVDEEDGANTNHSDDSEIPSKFICPLTLEIMNDPVVSRYGQSYERSAIVQWLSRGRTACPMTRQPLRLSGLITHHKLLSEIALWKSKHGHDQTKVDAPSLSSIGVRNHRLTPFIGVIDFEGWEEYYGNGRANTVANTAAAAPHTTTVTSHSSSTAAAAATDGDGEQEAAAAAAADDGTGTAARTQLSAAHRSSGGLSSSSSRRTAAAAAAAAAASGRHLDGSRGGTVGSSPLPRPSRRSEAASRHAPLLPLLRLVVSRRPTQTNE